MEIKYICQLPIEKNIEIYHELHRVLFERGYRGRVLEEYVQSMMNGRISDLENTIDVSKFFKT